MSVAGGVVLPRHPVSRRSEHSRRFAFAIIGGLIFILVALNVVTGFQASRTSSSLFPENVQLRSYSARRLSDLLDQWFYQEEDDLTSSSASGNDTAPRTPSHAKEGAAAVDMHQPSTDVAAAADFVEEAEEDQLLKRKDRKWQFAEDVAAELSVHGDAMVVQGEAFASYVTSMGPHVGGEEAVDSCAYLTEGRRIKKFEYSHRKKRDGEFRTVEYYHAVRGLVLAGGGGDLLRQHVTADLDNLERGPAGEVVWQFSPEISTVLNHFPVSVTDDPSLNISKPFGSWSSVFYPVDDFMSHHQDADIPRYLRPPQVIDATPPLFAAVSRNAFLTQGHMVTCGGHALTAGGCLWDFGMGAGPHHKLKARRVAIGIPLCDKWCNGYYHFTHEHLPRLALVHALLTDPNSNAQLVLSHAPNGFQRGFLFDVLGIPRSRVLHSVNAIAAVGVYPMPQRCGNTFTHLLHMMRTIIHQRLALSPSTNVTFNETTGQRIPHLLFAIRGGGSRMPTNWNELKQNLMAEFEGRMTFETTSGEGGPRAQIGKFYRADIVLGPHGANLANMMWMRRGMHVIEINAAGDGNMCYYTTAGRVGLVHHLLLRSGSKAGKYSLDYALFRTHVATALAAVEEAIAEERLMNPPPRQH